MTRHEIKNTTGGAIRYQHEIRSAETDPLVHHAYGGPVTVVPVGTSEHVDLPKSVVDAIEAAEHACPNGPLQIRRLP